MNWKEKVTVRRVNGNEYPSLNVKVYEWVNLKKLEHELCLTEKQAQQISEMSWELAHMLFWRDKAQLEAESVFNEEIDVFQDERMGGWLIVEGLPHPKKWKDHYINKWTIFKNKIEDLINYYKSIKFIKKYLNCHVSESVGITIPKSKCPLWTARLRKMESEKFTPLLKWDDCNKPTNALEIKSNLVMAMDKAKPSNDLTHPTDVELLYRGFHDNLRKSDYIESVYSYDLFVVSKNRKSKAEIYIVCGKPVKLMRTEELSLESVKEIAEHLSRLLDVTLHRTGGKQI